MALTKHTAHAYNYIQTKRVSCQISCQFGNFEIDTLLEEFMQARSCLYASTQLNPHYFAKKIFFSKNNVVWNSAAFARSDNYHTEYFLNHIA